MTERKNNVKKFSAELKDVVASSGVSGWRSKAQIVSSVTISFG